MSQHDGEIAARLQALLDENGWSAETRLYRSTRPEFLSPGGAGGAHRLTANDDPSEAVVDLYGQGHTALAASVGPGLAFAETQDHDWRAPDRTAVAVRLGDVLSQGGLVYPVASVVTSKVWYVTLPSGGVDALEV